MELPAQRLDLPRTKLSAKNARLHTREVCAAVGALPDDDPLSVVVELVTNALKHTKGSITLFWWVEGRRLLFAVADDDFVVLPWGTLRLEPDVDGENGRGLEIASILADDLGYGPTPSGGKWIRVGFVLPTPSDAETLTVRQHASLDRPSWHDAPSVASYRGEAATGDIASGQHLNPPIAVSRLVRPRHPRGSSSTLTTKAQRDRHSTDEPLTLVAPPG
ncbi:ATP-binding protein [Streptomyces sp. SID3343]|uniref:ATP-binding protein n=1 Tax=Streptomyces sp. SID3343 TaxID=2690260 RepID=UPI00136BC33A|nr:ATP-binding protein [Streptomyces sp. SID3343]MYW06407.1 hypothetical protein [Streptomyces sp. SID3343]